MDTDRTTDTSRTMGHNGVAIAEYNYDGSGYRSYEVYQRERVGQSTERINGAQLASAEYASNPYPLLTILREHYPCYRDWINNCYWITRFDDVTSIFTDEANFETRPKLWYYAMPAFGRNLNTELPVQWSRANAIDHSTEQEVHRLIERMLQQPAPDLVRDVAARLPVAILARTLDVPERDEDWLAVQWWQAQRGASWYGPAQQAGRAALDALTQYFTPLLASRNSDSAEDLCSVVRRCGGNARDLVTTLLESDHETLHGSLANFWMLLLTHPEALAAAKADRLQMKVAYLEALRHSPPVITAERFARHEVERFGRLLPKGALLRVSALAANRDPRLFADADTFVFDRRDLCHREARGQYRADGLPTGITFGLGPPTRFPAVPEDRPRSLYALNRDAAVTATRVLLERCPNIALTAGTAPVMRMLRIGEMYTCWQLPVAVQSASTV